MLQFNLLTATKRRRFKIELVIPLLVLMIHFYFIKTKDYSFSKAQYDHYRSYLYKTMEIQNETRIHGLSINVLKQHLDWLMKALPKHMQLEKMIIDEEGIWINGFVIDYREFSDFWQQLKQHLLIKKLSLIHMEHIKPYLGVNSWKFSMKMSF